MKKYKVVSFEWFAYACPYYTSEHDINNWYGCEHPLQEETEPDCKYGIVRGKCYCFSCPLGFTIDEEDWDDPGYDFDGADKGDFVNEKGGWIGNGDHIAISIDPDASRAVKQALYNYERWQNRYEEDWDGGTWKHLHRQLNTDEYRELLEFREEYEKLREEEKELLESKLIRRMSG